MNAYKKFQQSLLATPCTWIVTGVAGFIGSHLLETLLRLNQRVIGLDNFATGHRHNLEAVRKALGEEAWKLFQFYEGDIRHLDDCKKLFSTIPVDYVLHQAALGSVPRSIKDPLPTHQSNVDGFFNMLVAAKEHGVKHFVYASSSSVYGDHPDLPKVETKIGKPLSPYAATKLTNEIYAHAFSKSYSLPCSGLRYFNVFGPRQDPNGEYAAVIPKWISALRHQKDVYINGDGETSRDFCFVDNAVQANLLAATASTSPQSRVYNIACGQRTTLTELFHHIRNAIADPKLSSVNPVYRDFRAGDIRHSLANIEQAKNDLGYEPQVFVQDGIVMTVRS
jgi:UDP-N-acetylglucosamine 4-epimerase